MLKNSKSQACDDGIGKPCPKAFRVWKLFKPTDMPSDHSSIDVLKEEKKLRRQRWKKMEESCTWWWSSRVETCQLTPVKIIRYRSKMSKRVSLNCLLYTSRDWTSGPNVSKVSKIWREEKPHPRCKREVNGNWIYAPYISWPRIGENLNSLIFDFARRL